jgi:archaemetzincin
VKEIAIWWIGASGVASDLLEAIRRRVAGEFGLPAGAHLSAERPEGTLDPRRGQHSSTKILHWLADHRPAGADRVLAVTDADLFIPILTFVFGEAQLDGAAAIVSTARLRTNHATSNMRLLTTRLAKECVHELGHTFGLIHCDRPGCVMTRSVSVLDVDAKTASFCENCWARYQELDREGRENHEQRADSNSDR